MRRVYFGEARNLASLDLPSLGNYDEIASHLRISRSMLDWLAWVSPVGETDHYRRYLVLKHTGGFRKISAPKSILRSVQLTILRTILERVFPADAAMAYQKRRSIVDHAFRHSRKAVVVHFDIANFFDAIGFESVMGVFLALGYSESVATVLGLLATDFQWFMTDDGHQIRPVRSYARCLPQGAPTSPHLSNLICISLDRHLSVIAARSDFEYSRYADDIAFSHNRPNAPIGNLITKVERAISNEGFLLNDEKFRVMRSHQRQVITGLTVNDGPHVIRDRYRRFRAQVHHFDRIVSRGRLNAIERRELEYIRGFFHYLRHVDARRAATLMKKYEWLA